MIPGVDHKELGRMLDEYEETAQESGDRAAAKCSEFGPAVALQAARIAVAASRAWSWSMHLDGNRYINGHPYGPWLCEVLHSNARGLPIYGAET